MENRLFFHAAEAMSIIFIDGDACPVKQEVYRVAQRYELKVILVANKVMQIPQNGWLELVLVGDQLDAADDVIAERVTEKDVVVTGDIPLAARCLKKNARVLDPRGRLYTEASIGEDLAKRSLMAHLRELGTLSGGPPPFDKQHRSRFLQRLDEIIQALIRESNGKNKNG